MSWSLRANKARAWSRTDWQLLAEGGWQLLVAWWRIRRHPMPEIIARLHRDTQPRGPSMEYEPLVRGVLRAKHLLPMPLLCLPESLAITQMLVRRGQPCDLVLGARLTDIGGLDAHAWVERDGIPINSPSSSAADHPVYLRESFTCQETLIPL